MYLSFYNLKIKPFQMSTDPDFLWMGEKHKEALATLEYAILENKGVLALTGDVGTGKTTLINALIKRLGKDILAATIYDPRLEIVDFFNIVAAAFKIEDTFEGKGQFILSFMQLLIKAHERNQKVLLIIDEAQGISTELLEEIRLLSNLEAEYTRLLNIFFVGQNEFDDVLLEYKNRALRQRVTIRYQIEPLTINETGDYIRHRLHVSGAQSPIFDTGAIEEIFAFSNGYPRLINIICDHALLSGYVRELKTINADVVKECRKELEISKMTSEKDSGPSEEDKVGFKLVSPMSESVDDQKRVKKHIMPMAFWIFFLAVIGTFAGYIYHYPGGNKKAELPLTSVQQQDTKYFSVNGESKKSQQQMVPSGSEASDISGPLKAGKVGNSNSFTATSPNSKIFKGTIPKEADSFQAVPSKQAVEETVKPTFSGKPNGPETSGTQKAVESGKAEAPNVSLGKPVEKESPKKVSRAKSKLTDVASSNLTQNTSGKIQTSGSTPAEISSNLKTSETQKKKTFKHVEIPETAKSMTEPVQAEKKIPEEYPSDPGFQKEKEPVSPESPSMEKEIALATAPVEKQSTVPGPRPLERPLKPEVLSEADSPAKREIAPDETVQPPVSPSNQNNDENQVDENAISSIGAVGTSETPDPVALANLNLKARLNAFLTEYCRTYAKKDLDKLITFFDPNAVEKGQPFRSWIPQYRRNFNKIDIMEYTIELDRYAVFEDSGLVKIEGIFNVKAKLAGSNKFRESTGQISMMLEADGNSFKVKQLDYQ